MNIRELDDVIAQWEDATLANIAETMNDTRFSANDRALACGMVSVLALSLMEHVISYATAKETNTPKAGSACH